MKKLNIAIIGQGRSGKDIHGFYYVSEFNKYYNIKYIVEKDPNRQPIAKKMYKGCEVLDNYTKLFDKKDIDIVVNSTYSQMHYPITKELLEHGFNVLVEKPMSRTEKECETLIKTAKKHNVKLAVFQQSLVAPYAMHAKEVIESGKLGHISQIKMRWNGFARRWDWQTLQKNVAGNAYNTGPHPIGIALSLLGWDEKTKVVYSKLETTANSSGDSDDFTKIILETPNKPMVDIETHSNCMYGTYFIQIIGDHGNYKTDIKSYEMKYYLDEENPKKPLVETSLMDQEYNPLYCSEKLNYHEEKADYDGDGFLKATTNYYEQLYYYLTEDKPMMVQPFMGKQVIRVCEKIHKDNPLPVKFK